MENNTVRTVCIYDVCMELEEHNGFSTSEEDGRSLTTTAAPPIHPLANKSLQTYSSFMSQIWKLTLHNKQ